MESCDTVVGVPVNGFHWPNIGDMSLVFCMKCTLAHRCYTDGAVAQVRQQNADEGPTYFTWKEPITGFLM